MTKRLLFVILSLCSFAACASGFDENEQRMIEWIDAHSEDAIALLEETVNISSGTMNHEGIRKVADVMRRELDALGLDTEWIEQPPELQRAGHLFGRKTTGTGNRFVLIGHLDTVFEAEDAFSAFVRDGDWATGPGVDDMKGGNVVIVYALRALQEAGLLDDIPVVVAYTGDEEKAGRPLAISRKHLIEAGQWADIGLGFESAIHADGSDWGTIARRSSSNWVLTVAGKRAHSSDVFSDRVGAGAIFEAARILNSFYEDVRGERELTFNAGTIQGGTDVQYDTQQNRGSTFGKTNVVAQTAIVHGGIRAISPEQLERAKTRMREIVAANLPQTSASIEFDEGYPPMAPTDGNRALLRALSEVNVDLGRGPMKELDPLKRGAADISFVAPYTDALAGMGPLGKGGHTPEESIDLTSLPLAIKRAAILIYRLSGARQPGD